MSLCDKNREVEPLKQGAKNVNIIYVSINRTDPQWQKTALNQAPDQVP
jgi:hypothetical protein